MATNRPGFLFANGGRCYIVTFGRQGNLRHRLDVAGADVNDGARVIQWDPIWGAKQQQWIVDPCGFIKRDDGSVAQEVRIWAGHSGRCLDIAGGDGPGTPVQVTPWKVSDEANPDGYLNQRWQIQEQTDGTVVIQSSRTNLVLDVMGDNLAGVPVGVQKRLGGSNQKFYLEPVPVDEAS